MIFSNDLMIGDLVLTRGTSVNSRLIRLLDGSSVNHAGLYFAPDRVVEVLNDEIGLQTRSLGASFAGNECVFARRHAASADASAVIGRARRYLDDGAKYAYEEIVLLAILVTTRRLPLAPSLSRLVRAVLDGAAGLLAILAQHGLKQMICSEFVYRCFREAGATGGSPFPVDIPSRGEWKRMGLESGAPTSEGGSRIDDESLVVAARRRGVEESAAVDGRPDGPDLGRLLEELESVGARYLAETESGLESLGSAPAGPELDDALLRFASALAATWSLDEEMGLEARRGPLAVLEAAAAHFVTPGDLERSGSFRDLGRIAPPGHRPA